MIYEAKLKHLGQSITHSNIKCPAIIQKALQIAKANIDKTFPVVGITEQMNRVGY